MVTKKNTKTINQKNKTMFNAKAQKFTQLMSNRLDKVIHSINTLKTLSNTFYYEYDNSQVDKLEEILYKSVDQVIDLYKNKGKVKNTYTL